MNKLFFATAWRALSWYIIAIVGVLLMLFACDPALSREACRTNTLDARMAFMEQMTAAKGIDLHMTTDSGGAGITRLIIISHKDDEYGAFVVFFKDGCQLPFPPLRISPEHAAKLLFGGKTLDELFAAGAEV